MATLMRLAYGVMLSWTTLAAAQSLNPTNFSSPSALTNDSTITLSLTATTSAGTETFYTALLNVTDRALNTALQGHAILTNYSNSQSNTLNQNISFISCDAAAGSIQPPQVLSQAVENAPFAVVLYSLSNDYCNLTNPPNFPYIYTFTASNASEGLIRAVERYGGPQETLLYAYIAPNGVPGLPPDLALQETSSSQTGTPTTKIAMIILYTITGIIVILFLAVITTGAVRAHRHPERYGLRAGVGRPRRSRAHGLARAMLDSLPIVKFGERDDATPAKPADELELGVAPQHGRVEMLPGSSSAVATPHPPTANRDDVNPTPSDPKSLPPVVVAPSSPTTATTAPHPSASPDPPSTSAPVVTLPESSAPGGIHPATSPHPSGPSFADAETQGCSICTDDFEVGQDQRVLPCNHRFHPACVDPWLLNVSGTCPLCRIDLHPPRRRRGAARGENGGEGGEGEEDDGEEEEDYDETGEYGRAPPLGLDGRSANARRRLSVRRSIVIGLMGVAGREPPELMSREERVRALRRLRGNREERRRREEAEEVSATVEEERRLGSRLRAVFRRRNEGRIEEENEEGTGR